MQAASQNQLAAYYMGIPVQAPQRPGLGPGGGGGGDRRPAAGAHHLRARQHGLHRPEGLSGGGGGRLRQPARRHRRRPDHRHRRVAVGLLPARGLQGHRRLRRGAGHAGGQAERPVRRERCARRSERRPCASSSRPTTRRTSAWPSTAARPSGTALLVLAAAGRALAAARVLAGAADLRADLRHRRPGADAAGGLHRPVLASAMRPSWAWAPTRRRC